MKLKVKIICGFRKDQEHTIDVEEAHKAYYLFMNPEKRAIFSDGLAIKGSDINSIVPDYNSTMGWNKSHILNEFDYNELRQQDIDRKISDKLIQAKEVVQRVGGDLKVLNLPLSEVKEKLLLRGN